MNLIALALDHTKIQLSDPRTKGDSLFLVGHDDYNFAIKFMEGFLIATGGQDITTRIWDIRKFNKE